VKRTVTCLTIVAEAVLEQRLLEDLAAAGARGWTITAARGSGPMNRRVSDLEGGSIRIEALLSSSAAEDMWRVLREAYFADYAVVAWAYDVQVARSEHFGS